MLPSLISLAARSDVFLSIQLEGEVCNRFEGGCSRMREERCPAFCSSCSRFRFREDVDCLWRISGRCGASDQHYDMVREATKAHTFLLSGMWLAGEERGACTSWI